MRHLAQLAKCGRFTGGPADIHGSVDIGVGLVVAGAAPKLVLGLAILFGAVAAGSAGSAGVAGIDGSQRYASERGFVREKEPQLRERPGVQNCPLLAPGLDPFADAHQLLDGDPAPGAFSFGNDLLGNAVIDVSGEPPLTPRQLLQPPFGGAGLLLLELGPQPAVAVAHGFDFAPAVPVAVRVAGNVGDAEIHTQKFARLYGSGGGKINRAVQVELSLSEYEIGLSLDPVEPLLLVLAVHQRDDYPAFRQRPEADSVQPLEAKNALVVGD